MSGKRLSREDIAHIEIGVTAISRPMSWLLSCFFLLTVFLVPVIQYQIDGEMDESVFTLLEPSVNRPKEYSFFRTS